MKFSVSVAGHCENNFQAYSYYSLEVINECLKMCKVGPFLQRWSNHGLDRKTNNNMNPDGRKMLYHTTSETSRDSVFMMLSCVQYHSCSNEVTGHLEHIDNQSVWSFSPITREEGSDITVYLFRAHVQNDSAVIIARMFHHTNAK